MLLALIAKLCYFLINVRDILATVVPAGLPGDLQGGAADGGAAFGQIFDGLPDLLDLAHAELGLVQ